MTTDPTLQRLADESAIRDLTARFSDCCGRADYDAFALLWAGNATWSIGEPYPQTRSGTEAIVDMLRQLMADWAHFVQLLHSGIVRIDGDTAVARWVVRENAKSRDGARSYDNLAIYEDRLARSDGHWRFVERRYVYIWLSDAELRGRSFSLPEGLTAFGDW